MITKMTYLCCDRNKFFAISLKTRRTMTELLTGWISNLRNADHVGVTTQIYETVKEAAIDNEMYKTSVAVLGKAIEAEDEAYRKTLKDWTVEELKKVDGDMDSYMRGIRQILSGHSMVPESEEMQIKALEMLQMWKDYDFRTSDGYNSESSKVINMFQDVQKRKSDAEALGVWRYFEKAEKLAQEVQKLLSERFTELSSRTIGEMRKARTQTDTSIRQTYQLISLLQNLAPSETLTALAKRLRAIEDYARVFYLKTQASKGPNDDVMPDLPDGGGNGGNNGGGTNPNPPSAGGE